MVATRTTTTPVYSDDFLLSSSNATLPISLRRSYLRLLLHSGLVSQTRLILLKRPRFPSDSYLNTFLVDEPTDFLHEILFFLISSSIGETERRDEVGQRGKTNLRMKKRLVGGGDTLLRVELLDEGMFQSSIIHAHCNHINLTLDGDGIYISKEYILNMITLSSFIL